MGGMKCGLLGGGTGIKATECAKKTALNRVLTELMMRHRRKMKKIQWEQEQGQVQRQQQ